MIWFKFEFLWIEFNRYEPIAYFPFSFSFFFLSQVQMPHVPRFTKTFSIRKGVALCSRRSFARIFLRSILHHTFIPSQPQIVVCRTLLCAPRNSAAFFPTVIGNFSSLNFYSFFLLFFKILIRRIDKLSLELIIVFDLI